MTNSPLVIDLDGTLIRSDLTYEICVLHLKKNWFVGLFEIIFWFFSDKATAKSKLAKLHLTNLNFELIPLTELVQMDLFKGARVKALVSGSDHRIVKEIANRIGNFELVQGSTPSRNLTGENKAAFLSETYPNGFDYIGDSSADLSVWKRARTSYGYNVSKSIVQTANRQDIILKVLKQKPSQIKPILKAMRMHHWSKNILLAVIPFLNLSMFELSWFLSILLAFVAFGLSASSTYIINDLLDIQEDRAHLTKRERPFASGTLEIKNGLISAISMMCIGLLIAFALSFNFGLMLIGYTVVSFTYSLYLKRIMVLDTLILSFLFCWRLISGGILLEMPANIWFVISMGFFFLSLAMGKRTIEIYSIKETDKKIAGRGYMSIDYLIVLISGICSSFICLVIVLIYSLLSKSTVINNDISIIIILFILLFWQVRFWLLTGRNQVFDDPIVFALKDRISIISLSSLLLVLIVEQFPQIMVLYYG
ncbi:UbiA family prenyltransferase [Alphaproteobacteria bacterium]|nr:UbiA family prenyltransferase [Alphaproteobacteria bacterium]